MQEGQRKIWQDGNPGRSLGRASANLPGVDRLWVNSFFVRPETVSPSRPALMECVAHSGGQEWPWAIAEGGPKAATPKPGSGRGVARKFDLDRRSGRRYGNAIASRRHQHRSEPKAVPPVTALTLFSPTKAT